MNVRLPDGTLIKNVPDNMTKAELVARLQANGYDSAKLQPQTQGTGSQAVDAGNAVGTGFWRGAVRLAGLPVDTAQNLIDLGKAGAGVLYNEVTGQGVPQALEVNQDRSNVTGSSDWLLKQARKSDAGRFMVDPVNPEFEGEYLQAGGGSLAGGVVNPRNVAQLTNQAGLSVVSSALGKGAADLTGDPALAVTASLLPNATQVAGGAGARRAVRGGEQGRKDMVQRVQDLKNAGVDAPTLGLASGNQVIGGVENLLQSTPGAVGTMKRARDTAVGGLQAKTSDAADAASLTRGSMEAGQAIQRGLRDFRESFKGKQTGLYDKLDAHIPPSTPVDVSRTKDTLSRLNEDIPGAPELSKQFRNARIQAIEQAVASDTSGSPNSVMVYQRPPVGSGGIFNAPAALPPYLVQVPQGPTTNQLPFQAVKKTRTLVGNEIADTNLASSVPRSKWSPLYGALAEDMRTAAEAQGPGAAQAFNRANTFGRSGMERLDRVQPFVNPDAPEQSFQMLNRTLGDNTSTFQAVKKSLPGGARGTFAATVIDKLGKATPGQQNDTGDVWSPETFLTNWNRMSAKGRKEVFSGFPNSEQVRRDVETVAKATSMMRDSSKMWANPSGTGANLATRLTLGALPFSAFVNPWAPFALGGGTMLSRGLAEAVTSPKSIGFFASKGGTPENTQGGLLLNMAKQKDQAGGERSKAGLLAR
jgi:hypothetical protein